MMAQDSLFDGPGYGMQRLVQANVDRGVRGKARRTDPVTSLAAAEKISASCENAIKALFMLPRQLSDDELCDLLPEWHGPTVITARSRLHRDGFLTDSGERRKSKRNRDQIVWCRAVA